MSQPTPFALDDLIVCDYSDWFSSLVPDALGLAGVAVRRNARTGRWPVLSGVDRGERRLTMQTTFGHTTDAAREAARLLLLQNLNYESEAVRRLLAADGMIYGAAPTHVLLACGPMNVHCDASLWYVQDLLQRYDGTLGGGWWTEPDSGIQLAEVATNKVVNPSAEAAANYALRGGATVTRSTSYSYRGGYSYKIVTTAAAGDGITLTMSALANAIHYMTARVYGACSTLQFSIDAGANWSTPALLGTDGNWYIYGYQFPAAQANGSVALGIQQSDAVVRTLYIDCVQVEETAYPTPYLDGSLGFGHSFSGTYHASTSARTAATLKFTNILSTTQGTLALTWTPIADNTGATRYLFSEGNLKAYFNSADDKIYFTDGTNTISTAALTFSTMTAQRLAFTWSSAGLKIYRNGVSAASGITYTAPTLGTYLYIGSTSASLSQASGWIDDLVVLDIEASTTAIGQLGNGALERARWLDVICESAQAINSQNYGIVSTFGIDDSIRWQLRDGDVAFWRVYSDTSNLSVNNLGDDDAYPVFHLTTRTAKTGVTYSRHVFIVWKATSSGKNYPVRITLPDLTGKAQADGDDIRVIVDGTEVDRWLDGTITGYNVWVNLNFSAAPSARTLSTGILVGDSASTIYLSGSTSTWPATGTILIESEAFVYTGKSGSTLTGVTRASKNTAAAAHAATTAVYLIQRDIVITYGDAALTAPVVDADYKPAFELDHSTNTSWVYEAFGDNNLKRTGAWVFACTLGTAIDYTANQGTDATPWTEMGIELTALRYGWGTWTLYNPCGVTAGNFTNGEYYCEVGITNMNLRVWSSINGSRPSSYDYGLVGSIKDGAWHAWSQNVSPLRTGAKYLVFSLNIGTYTCGSGSTIARAEVSDVTATINSSYTPVITIGIEMSSGAAFEPTITNVTTGEAITLSAAIGADVTMTVDTANKTLLLSDGSSRLDALTLSGARREWLRFAPGVNQLTFSDTGTTELEMEIEWNRRYFE